MGLNSKYNAAMVWNHMEINFLVQLVTWQEMSRWKFSLPDSTAIVITLREVIQ